jgi:hypothetical protein
MSETTQAPSLPTFETIATDEQKAENARLQAAYTVAKLALKNADVEDEPAYITATAVVNAARAASNGYAKSIVQAEVDRINVVKKAALEAVVAELKAQNDAKKSTKIADYRAAVLAFESGKIAHGKSKKTPADNDVLNVLDAAEKAAYEAIFNGFTVFAKPGQTGKQLVASVNGAPKGQKTLDALAAYDSFIALGQDDTTSRKSAVMAGHNDGTLGNAIMARKRAAGLVA